MSVDELCSSFSVVTKIPEGKSIELTNVKSAKKNS